MITNEALRYGLASKQGHKSAKSAQCACGHRIVRKGGVTWVHSTTGKAVSLNGGRHQATVQR